MYDQLFGRNKLAKASDAMLMKTMKNQDQLMNSLDNQLDPQVFSFEKLFDMPLSQSNNKLDYMNQDVDMGGLENELTLISTNHTLVSHNAPQKQDSNIFGGYTDLFQNDAEPILAIQNRHSSEGNLSEFLTGDNFLGDISWDFGLRQPGNVNSYYGDSTTLGSEPRTSNEFFDSSSQTETSQDEHESKKSRFSNTLISIFRNKDKEKFYLRGINPLSTHRDPSRALTDSFPNVTEGVDNLSFEETQRLEENEGDEEVVVKKCFKNLHTKNCDCIPKKRSTTNTILTSLANARLGFNSRQAKKSSPLQESVINEEEFEDSLPAELVTQHQFTTDPALVDFDEELTRVISLASKHNATYNFNSNDLSSVELKLSSSSLQQKTPKETSEIGNGDSELKEEDNHSPDYAALFADMNATKKKSKSLSFRKRSEAPKIAKKSPYPSFDDKTIEVIPMKESARGRKPSLEYDATKTFVCTYCSRRFRRQEHLKRHFRSLHTNEKPFDCHFCGKKFSRSDNLAQHIKTHNSFEAVEAMDAVDSVDTIDVLDTVDSVDIVDSVDTVDVVNTVDSVDA